MEKLEMDCYKNYDSWLSFFIGVVFFSFFTIIIVLPILGDYGHKPANPKNSVIKFDKSSPVFVDVKTVNTSQNIINNEFWVNVKMTKPKSKISCNYIGSYSIFNGMKVGINNISSDVTIKNGDEHFIKNWYIRFPDQLEIESFDDLGIESVHKCNNDNFTITTIKKPILK